MTPTSGQACAAGQDKCPNNGHEVPTCSTGQYGAHVPGNGVQCCDINQDDVFNPGHNACLRCKPRQLS
jgi:hypothetical protein